MYPSRRKICYNASEGTLKLALLKGLEQGSVGDAMADVIHFERPPLDEVVCGVQFGGVEWSSIHFGLFYTKIAERYHRTQQRPPLAPSLFETILLEQPT